MDTSNDEQMMLHETREAFTMHTPMEQEEPLITSQKAQEVLLDERLNLKRMMNEDLPSVFQIDAINVMTMNIPKETLPEAYNRMREISLKMTLAARLYRSAAVNQNTHEMESRYAEAAELKKQFYDSKRETKALQTGTSDDAQQEDVIELQEPQQGYFIKKKAKKQKKAARNLRTKQLEKEFGEQYRSTAKVKQNETLDATLLESAYVKEIILTKKTVYKNETGQEVTTTQGELLEKAKRQDYSRLEQLEPALRHMLATEFMQENKALFTGDAKADAKTLETRFPGGLMNPLLRLGISLGMRQCLGEGQQTGEYYKNLDAWMNCKIMQNTLAPFKHAEQVGNTFSQADVDRNAQSQLFIAKTMLMCHMGSFVLRNTNKDTKEKIDGDWQGPVANAFSHCSRVGIVLPGMQDGSYTKEGEQKIVNSYTGGNGGLDAGFFVRGGATHTLFRKSKEKALIKTGFKELKFFSPRHQRGMNVAVGGLGNSGITGADGTERMLKNDGSCGHIYMHLEEGDSTNYTSMLVGFESDSYQKTNQLGHTHGFGNGEFASSFGGQRVDEIGDKYGGRNLDLTGIPETVFRNVMQRFETNYTQLQRDAVANNQEAIHRLETMNQMLCGERMTLEALQSFIRNMIPGEPNLSEDSLNRLQS